MTINTSFKRGCLEGFRLYLPYSMGFIPWGLVTGIAMRSAGLSTGEALGMNLLVYGGTAQLGTLPLIAHGAPLWLIALTALVLNLRFLIFSATLSPAFRTLNSRQRWLSGYVLSDGVVAACSAKLLTERDADWRYGFYLAPSLWSWACWQLATLAGILLAEYIPRDWSLGFMATIALLVLLVPMCKKPAMLIAALVGGSTALLLRGLPLRMGLLGGILLGMAAGHLAEQWLRKDLHD